MAMLGIEGIADAERVAVGGMAVVYRARDLNLDRTVAVKVLKPGDLGSRNPQLFERECLIGMFSGRPNIAQVHRAGISAHGQPYLIMDYFPRGSLQGRLHEVGRISWREAVEIGFKLSPALQSAHEMGVFHLDVKPGNVMIADDGEPQLADFGIAQATNMRESVGYSLYHAAPEVLRGEDGTPAADVYSLASTLFELIVGRPAFASDAAVSQAEVRDRVLTEPVPASLAATGVPKRVRQVIETAMAKDPNDRPMSAAAFAAELRSAMQLTIIGRHHVRQVVWVFIALATFLTSMRVVRAYAPPTSPAFNVYFFGCMVFVMSFVVRTQDDKDARSMSGHFWWGGLAFVAAAAVIAIV
jgi:serine/threonine protein kinase